MRAEEPEGSTPELTEAEIAERVAAVRRELGLGDASGHSPKRRAPNRSAMAALVLGVLALCCLGFLAAVPALVYGAVAVRTTPRGDRTGRTMSIAGIVAALLGCAWSIPYAVSLAT